MADPDQFREVVMDKKGHRGATAPLEEGHRAPPVAKPPAAPPKPIAGVENIGRAPKQPSSDKT
jgi:hypothetical protein